VSVVRDVSWVLGAPMLLRERDAHGLAEVIQNYMGNDLRQKLKNTSTLRRR